MMPAPAAESDRPIFIVGANGTGSTLLRLMLDSHERIAIPGETGFLRLALAHTWVPFWPLGGQWHTNLGLSDDALVAVLADFYGGLFSSYAESRGKQRWGDKTPFHVWHLELARRLYPDCQVVGIVRHPGAVISSQRRRFRRTYAQASQSWTRSTSRLMFEAMDLGDQCVVLRYEDLVAEPEKVARALLDWLGEPWSDAVLDHHEIQPRSGGPSRAEGFTDVDRPIDTAQVGEWEGYLRGAERQRVLAPTRAVAAFFGYDCERTLPLGDFGTAGSPLMTGTALRDRRTTHGAGIDWNDRPEPGFADRQTKPPLPRRRRQPPSLDDVTIRALLQHRIAEAGHRLPDGIRNRANDARRKSGWLDRLLGPRT